jgi:hypothetical protein
MYQTLKPKEEKSELDRLRDTAAVIKEFAGDGKGGIESGWEALAKVGEKAIDQLSPLLSGITGQKIPAAPVGPVLPVKPAALSVVSPQVLPGASEIPIEQPAISPADDLQHWLGAQLKFFKTKAQAGKDPGFWIDYVFENAEEPGCQAILYAIRQGATFENLLSFDAEIAQNPQLTFWFRTVYDAVKSELSRDVDSGGESGDARHPASDGTTSPPGLPGTGSSPAGFTLS